MKLNSVIFHTTRLPELRDFYEGLLGLPLGTYSKDGKEFPDFSADYVNYHLPNALLCFETDKKRVDVGTVVLNVENYSELQKRLANSGAEIVSSAPHYFKVKDPEGRSLIFEPAT